MWRWSRHEPKSVKTSRLARLQRASEVRRRHVQRGPAGQVSFRRHDEAQPSERTWSTPAWALVLGELLTGVEAEHGDVQLISALDDLGDDSSGSRRDFASGTVDEGVRDGRSRRGTKRRWRRAQNELRMTAEQGRGRGPYRHRRARQLVGSRSMNLDAHIDLGVERPPQSTPTSEPVTAGGATFLGFASIAQPSPWLVGREGEAHRRRTRWSHRSRNQRAVHASAPPQAPDPVDAFTLWSTANGLTLNRIACSTTEVITCYGMDAAQATTTATMNPDGSFAVVTPTSSVAAAATTVAPVDPSAGVGTREQSSSNRHAHRHRRGLDTHRQRGDARCDRVVTADNMFNDPPPEGSVYVMINITVSYNGPDDKALDFFTVSGVTGSNVELNTYDNFVWCLPRPTTDSPRCSLAAANQEHRAHSSSCGSRFARALHECGIRRR